MLLFDNFDDAHEFSSNFIFEFTDLILSEEFNSSDIGTLTCLPLLFDREFVAFFITSVLLLFVIFCENFFEDPL